MAGDNSEVHTFAYPASRFPVGLAASLGDPTYLGNPEVVTWLISQYCLAIVDVTNRRADEAIDAAAFLSEVRELGAIYARIFGGLDPGYKPIAGFNNGSLPYNVRSILGEYWQRERAKYDDDALRVLFAWIAWSVWDTFRAEDSAIADLKQRDRMRIVVETLLGVNARA